MSLEEQMDQSIFAVKDAILRKCLRKKYSN